MATRSSGLPQPPKARRGAWYVTLWKSVEQADQSGAAVTVAESDTEVIAAQLGRRPRGVRAIACRCPCGLPCVIETAPRLDDGAPFPTLYYLTCPQAVRRDRHARSQR